MGECIPDPCCVDEDKLMSLQLLSKWGYFGGESLEDSLGLLNRKPRTWKDFVLDTEHPAWRSLQT